MSSLSAPSIAVLLGRLVGVVEGAAGLGELGVGLLQPGVEVVDAHGLARRRGRPPAQSPEGRQPRPHGGTPAPPRATVASAGSAARGPRPWRTGCWLPSSPWWG